LRQHDIGNTEQTEFTGKIHKIALDHVTGNADFDLRGEIPGGVPTIDDTVLRAEDIRAERQTYLLTNAFEALSITERFENGSSSH